MNCVAGAGVHSTSLERRRADRACRGRTGRAAAAACAATREHRSRCRRRARGRARRGRRATTIPSPSIAVTGAPTGRARARSTAAATRGRDVIHTTARADSPSARTSASASRRTDEPGDGVLVLERELVGAPAGDPVRARRARRAARRGPSRRRCGSPVGGSRGQRARRHRSPSPTRAHDRVVGSGASECSARAPTRPSPGPGRRAGRRRRPSGWARASRRSGPVARAGRPRRPRAPRRAVLRRFGTSWRTRPTRSSTSSRVAGDHAACRGAR